MDLSVPNMFIGDKLPRQVFVCFVENAAVSGSLGKNPFVFANYSISQFALLVNGFR